MARNYKQGLFVPKNPQKYVGDLSKLKFKSFYELSAFKIFDRTPQILIWSYEADFCKIPYYSSIEQKHRTYYPDIVMKQKNNKGVIETLLIEIKPYSQTIPPKRGKRKKPETYLQEITDYNINCDKWKFAREWCAKNKVKFVIVDEYTLGLKKRK